MRQSPYRSVRVVLAGVAALQLACGSTSPVAPSSGGEATLFGKAPASGSVGAKNVAPDLVLRTTPAMNGNTISGQVPLTVMFNLCPSSDADPGDSLNWQFNFGDSGKPAFNPNGTFNPDFDQFCRIEHTYDRSGTYTATVSVTDKHLEDQSRGVASLARKTQTVIIQAGAKPDAPGCSALGINTNFDAFTSGTTTVTLPGGTLSGGQILSVAGFVTMSGNQYLTNGVGGSFTISFANDQSAASFQFATSSAAALTVQGYSGAGGTGTLLFTAPFNGVVQPGGTFPEGTGGGSAVFRSLVFSSTAQVAIDNLSSTPLCQ